MTQPTPSRVLGLDLSLACTGVAGNGWTDTLKPPAKMRGADRLLWIKSRIVSLWIPGTTLAAIEGPAYGSQASRQRGHHERAGLWWMVRCSLHSLEVPTVVIDPTKVKQYATGKGNADKAAVMLAVARRFPWFDGGEDEADALVLAAMAADHLGAPMADMPAANRKALDAVQWPDLARLVPAGHDGTRHDTHQPQTGAA